MGIVYNTKVGKGYNSNVPCRRAISRRRVLNALTRQNIQFLRSLGLRVVAVFKRVVRFVINAICHLFEEIRYQLNAIVIDRCKNVGLTSLMKGFVSFSPSQSSVIENAGWLDIAETQRLDDNGYFDVSIPLGMILGFAEDYRKIVVNAKHELILTRSNSDVNSIVQTQVVAAGANVYEDYQVEITKIEWLLPHVLLSDKHKIKLLNHLEKDKPVTISFRSWELYEYPLLPSTSKHVWTVKTANQLEKPRFVFLGFQTNCKGRKTANASRFDHCNISNVTLFLNSQHYPYGNLNLNITNNQYALLYDMYANFQNAYYNKEVEPMLKKVDYLLYAALVVIDCSKQNESLKQASVDVRLEFEARANIPVGTSVYCLILDDRIVEYNPMSGDVKKIV
ncbi:uncharacterized protein LOC103318060 [Nasonia vitripennis]|uniref:Double jelly roll-like domain-containing protein n=1 Tax=Nasonia vitripennis TaxID=7425 RepID=A0A7M7HJA5_NASVI|nr:uncharacterized protein LOC103318060 [Nasonia vitripennis]